MNPIDLSSFFGPLFALPFLLIPVVVGLMVWGFLAERKRREALAREVTTLGLHLDPNRNRDLAKAHQHLPGFNEGGDRYAFNVVTGEYRGRPVTAFDYHYETTSTDSEGRTETTSHHRHVYLLRVEREFPRLELGPEGVLSRIGQALGFDDIDFESHEFSRRFCVRSKDRRFAYDFFAPTVMELVMAHPPERLFVEGSLIAIIQGGRMPVGQLRPRLDFLSDLRERLPGYLFAA